MGCTTSRESTSPYDNTPSARAAPTSSNHAPESSRAAILNPPTTSFASRSASRSPARASNSANAHDTNASQRPNAPLRSPSPVPRSPENVVSAPAPPWTRKELERQREAFFDTRVSGDEQVWNGLRIVAEMLRRGEIREAEGVLEGLGVNCPTGRVVEGRGRKREGEEGREKRRRGGVFDGRGREYALPPWVVADPDDVIEDDGSAKEAALLDAQMANDAADVEPADLVKVRARLSDRGTDVLVEVGKAQKVAVLAARVRDKAGIKGRLRLAYLGRMLEENKTLEDQGWREGHVVSALVFE